MSLLDQYCPVPHEAPITGAACDSQTGASITSDSWGVIAITRPNEQFPALVFQPGTSIYGAVCVSWGGALVAVGDESGMVAVYNTWDANCIFHDMPPEGEERPGYRALALNPQGTILAALAADGSIRIFDINRWEILGDWSGFGGESLEFDSTGDRLLCIDNRGQPKLIDMMSQSIQDMDLVPGAARVARFCGEGLYVATMGMAGLTLLQLPDGTTVNSFNARGSSGMVNLLVSPEGNELAALTGRSVHRFSVPDLEPAGSDKHGAPDPTGPAWWDWRGVSVAGADMEMHRPNEKASLGQVVSVSGFADRRVSAHAERIAVWEGDRQRRPFQTKHTFVEVKIDRDGRLVAGLPNDGNGIQIYEARTGRHLFDAGVETADTPKLEVGGTVVACMMPRGGLRWYDLKANNVFELPWVQTFALSGGGTWIGAITPKGKVKVLDPATGKNAIPNPEPLADVPVKLVSFVNRRPDMLILDEEGVLGVYDLAVSVREGRPAQGEDILDLNVPVDRLWGITGGRYAALRIQEYQSGTATVIFVDLDKGEVVSEVPNLLPYVWVDPENGFLLQPGRGGAVLEMDMYGQERRVMRSMPGLEWITFGPNGVIDSSGGALR